MLGGEYRVRVKDPVTGEYSEVNFQVASLSAERRSAVRNVALQNAISAETDGKAYDLTTVGSLVDDIRVNPRLGNVDPGISTLGYVAGVRPGSYTDAG